MRCAVSELQTLSIRLNLNAELDFTCSNVLYIEVFSMLNHASLRSAEEEVARILRTQKNYYAVLKVSVTCTGNKINLAHLETRLEECKENIFVALASGEGPTQISQ